MKNIIRVCGVVMSVVLLLLTCKLLEANQQYEPFNSESIIELNTIDTTTKKDILIEELNGIVTITVAVIIITGVVGNVLADFVYKLFHVTHPVAKGVGLGTSAHAIGTAKALEMGEIEGAMGGLSIAVAGILTVIVAPIFSHII